MLTSFKNGILLYNCFHLFSLLCGERSDALGKNQVWATKVGMTAEPITTNKEMKT
jgi:hypothetical protein